MNNGFFNDIDENEEFRDQPDEMNGAEAPPVQVQVKRTATPVVQQPVSQNYVEQIVEEAMLEEIEEDYTEVLSDARLRLEQGRLYEMIMNHNLFEGADADEKAIKNVTREIRNFAKERMEVMLGMRQEQNKETSQVVGVELPFNSLEIEVLKMVAATASKGRTSTINDNATVPVVRSNVGLKPISISNKRPTPTSAPIQRVAPSATVQQSPLRQAAKMPVKKTARQELEEQILREEGITREQLNSVFPPSYKPLEAHPSQIDTQKLIDRNKNVATIAGSTKKADNPSKLPMPSQEQENTMHATRVQSDNVQGGGQINTILNLLNQVKK